MGTLLWWWRSGFSKVERRVRQLWEEVKSAGKTIAEDLSSQTVAWIDEQRTHVKEAMDSVLHEFNEQWGLWFRGNPPAAPRRIKLQVLLAVYAEAGGWCFVALEMFVAALLAAIYFNAPLAVAMTIGAALTFIVAIFAKAGLASLIIGRWEQNPRAGIKAMLALFGFMFVVEIAMVGFVLFVARGISGEQTDALFGIMSGALATWTPLTAGVLFGLSGLWKWSGVAATKWERLGRLERKLESLRSYCAAQLEKLGAVAPSNARQAPTVVVAEGRPATHEQHDATVLQMPLEKVGVVNPRPTSTSAGADNRSDAQEQHDTTLLKIPLKKEA